MSTAHKTQKSATGVWTDDEDTLLAHWQGRVGNKWSEVAKHIAGKTGQQCAQRWRHRVNPNISREKWSEDEDGMLADLVDKYGSSWAEIARRLPGRTDQQCMGRWRRHLDPTIKRDGWEEEEDEQLRELYGEYGSSWSCISKSMHGRTAQQCRARWCQLTNAERPSRSSASRSKSYTTTSTLGEQANPRRQSTANTAGSQELGGGRAAVPAAGQATDALELFAAAAAAAGDHMDLYAAAEGGAAAAAAGASAGAGSSQRWPARSAARGCAGRRLSAVSEDGMKEEGMSQVEDEDDSPEFMVRKTTARTAARASQPAAHLDLGSSDAAGVAFLHAQQLASAAMAAAALPQPIQQEQQQQQHDHLQPPAPPARSTAAGGGAVAGLAEAALAAMVSTAAADQQALTPVQAMDASCPAPDVALPDALLLVKQEPPENRMQEEDDDSPTLTHNACHHANVAADMLSPMRGQLPGVPPLFTPSSSGRKRPAPSRMSTFGPALPPLVIPDTAPTAIRAAGTPVRPTPGSGPMSLELRSPNVLTLLQSPQQVMDDLFRSPGFGSMLTPPWAKGSRGSSGGSKKGAGGSGSARFRDAAEEQPNSGGQGAGQGEEGGVGSGDDRRHSVARRLDTAPSFSSLVAADLAAAAAAAAMEGATEAHQQQHCGGGGSADCASMHATASFDFGVMLGSPLKKSKTGASPVASGLMAATAPATTLWHAAAASMLLQADSAGGGTSLAMAVQQHLLLASTAKVGPGLLAAAVPSDKENGALSRQATLTAAKPTAGGASAAAAAAAGASSSPVKQLTSSNVRMKLHALLEHV